MPRFSRTGFSSPAGLREQGVVLHVAGADLDDVGVLLHQFQGVVVHRLGDDREARLLPHLVEDLQARLAQSLEGVG